MDQLVAGLFIAQGVAGVAFQRFGDIDAASSADDFSNRLGVQIAIAVVAAVLMTVMAYVGHAGDARRRGELMS